MNEQGDPNRADDPGAADLLISRIVDRRATPEDWRALRRALGRDAEPRGAPGGGAGDMLAEIEAAHRIDADLCRAVEGEIGVSERVELPPMRLRAPERRLRLVGTWGGWAAAAGLALAWIMGVQPPAPDPGDGTQQAGPIPGAGWSSGQGPSVEEAFDQYVRAGRESGRIVRVDPELRGIDSTPLENGAGVEVIYLRRVLERAVIDDVYRYATDDLGRVVPVRVEAIPRRGGPM